MSSAYISLMWSSADMSVIEAIWDVQTESGSSPKAMLLLSIRNNPIDLAIAEWQRLIDRINAAAAYWLGVNSRNSALPSMNLHIPRAVFPIYSMSVSDSWSIDRRRWNLSRNIIGLVKKKSNSRAKTILSSMSIRSCFVRLPLYRWGSMLSIMSKQGVIGCSIFAAMRSAIVAS